MAQFIVLLAALLVIASAQAARLPHAIDDFDLAASGSLRGLRSTAQSSILRIMSRGSSAVSRRDDDDDEVDEQNAYVAIRFYVPPHVSDDFEDAWAKLDDEVDDEKENEVHSLRSQKLDNFVYISYGEWSSLHGLHKHLTSRHFEKFSDFVDDSEVLWQLELLGNESEDIEDKQEEDEDRGRKHIKKPKRKVSEISKSSLKLAANHEPATLRQLYKDLQRHKELAHVLIKYFVSPADHEAFEEAWEDAAEDTIEEDGNRYYALRKVATDNTKYYTYGAWDSYRDFMDHWDSKHVEKLKEFLDKEDIYYTVEPLEAVDEDDRKKA